MFLSALILASLTTLNIHGAVYDVGGTVVDTNGQPVSDACILLMGNNNVLTTYTDQNGQYSFPGMEGGNRYTISACKYTLSPVVDPSPGSGAAIMDIAEGELGNTDGPSPGLYHGHGDAWCSEFVSWVYWQAGDPFTGGATDGGACTEDWNMSNVYRIQAGFARNESWQLLPTCEINAHWSPETEAALTPQPGDYVLFSNTTGIDRSHSGLVREILGEDMKTIEGNVSDEVRAMTRADWRTDQVGNTIVAGIGYRRRVSQVYFNPTYHYGWLFAPLTVDFTAIPELIPGDANHDGYVDKKDARILAENWLETDRFWDHGDFNDDGRVDDLDASILAAHWGTSPAESHAVPEPGTLMLLLGLGGLALLLQRRMS
ncbi:MAG: carboxypeptidase regulatory-like domain-containing protein [Pirellulales bacterium]|nr:carboxypeptidase regulatory-like domain-containing protein [Pirellulales bacterium]